MTGPPVTIRGFTSDDVPPFLELAADRRVTRFVGDGTPWTTQRSTRRAESASLPTSRWSSIVVDDRTWAGIVTLEHTDPHGAEFGIWIHPDHWGHHVGTTAATLALEQFAGEFPGMRVIAHVDPANTGSRRLLSTLGFRHVTDTVSRYGTLVGEHHLARPGTC